MKRILLALVMLASPVMAEPNIQQKSSFTRTADTVYIGSSTYLDKVVIGIATSGGTLEIYNSTHTTSLMISSISLATAGMYDFNNLKVKGIYYRTTLATNGVTILYK